MSTNGAANNDIGALSPETFRAIESLSRLLNTGLTTRQLECCVRLLESGIDTDALIAAIRLIDKENNNLQTQSNKENRRTDHF